MAAKVFKATLRKFRRPSSNSTKTWILVAHTAYLVLFMLFCCFFEYSTCCWGLESKHGKNLRSSRIKSFDICNYIAFAVRLRTLRASGSWGRPHAFKINLIKSSAATKKEEVKYILKCRLVSHPKLEKYCVFTVCFFLQVLACVGSLYRNSDIL